MKTFIETSRTEGWVRWKAKPNKHQTMPQTLIGNSTFFLLNNSTQWRCHKVSFFQSLETQNKFAFCRTIKTVKIAIQWKNKTVDRKSQFQKILSHHSVSSITTIQNLERHKLRANEKLASLPIIRRVIDGPIDCHHRKTLFFTWRVIRF